MILLLSYLPRCLGSFYLSTSYHLLYSRIHSIGPSLYLSQHLVRSGSSHILYRRRRSSFITVRNSDLGVLYISLFPSGLGGTFDYFSRQYRSGKGFFFILLLGDPSLIILVHDTIGWAKPSFSYFLILSLLSHAISSRPLGVCNYSLEQGVDILHLVITVHALTLIRKRGNI